VPLCRRHPPARLRPGQAWATRPEGSRGCSALFAMAIRAARSRCSTSRTGAFAAAVSLRNGPRLARSLAVRRVAVRRARRLNASSPRMPARRSPSGCSGSAWALDEPRVRDAPGRGTRGRLQHGPRIDRRRSRARVRASGLWRATLGLARLLGHEHGSVPVQQRHGRWLQLGAQLSHADLSCFRVRRAPRRSPDVPGQHVGFGLELRSWRNGLHLAGTLPRTRARVPRGAVRGHVRLRGRVW